MFWISKIVTVFYLYTQHGTDCWMWINSSLLPGCYILSVVFLQLFLHLSFTLSTLTQQGELLSADRRCYTSSPFGFQRTTNHKTNKQLPADWMTHHQEPAHRTALIAIDPSLQFAVDPPASQSDQFAVRRWVLPNTPASEP